MVLSSWSCPLGLDLLIFTLFLTFFPSSSSSSSSFSSPSPSPSPSPSLPPPQPLLPPPPLTPPQTDIAKKVAELGGIYKNDLTHEVTHLVVGDYNTPKYRHVAYERPDIQPMCAGWVDAVLCLWTQDAPIDLDALEQEWRLHTFEANGGLPAGPDGRPVDRERLLCSMTGFEEGE